MMPSDWRNDPDWKLVQWDGTFWTSQPPDKPTPNAELTGDGAWADQYENHRSVATWFRVLPMKPRPR